MIGSKGRGVEVVCKQCGKNAKADEFVLDPYFKKMVCPSCVKDRMSKSRMLAKGKEQALEQETKTANRPAGWDEDDELLERAHKQSKPASVQVERVGADKVKLRCQKCNYAFVYNTALRTPKSCPYCNAALPKIPTDY